MINVSNISVNSVIKMYKIILILIKLTKANAES